MNRIGLLGSTWLLLILVIHISSTFAQIQTYQYQESFESFPNPERGFYRYTSLHRLDPTIGRIRNEGHSLIWGKVDLQPYRNSPTLPPRFLAEVSKGFQIARQQGLKVIVRGSYGHRGSGGDYRTYQDPPKQNIERHIRQLGPVFAANEDVIALFEAGFIGPWGEWHGTEIAQDYVQARDMVQFILKHTPRNRMVLLRYPYLKQQIFKLENDRAGAESFEVVSELNAYSGEPIARVGHHNDCFLSSPTDVGTYARGGATRREETAYLAQETLHTVFGGETCKLHELNDGQRAIEEMTMLHASYLNSGYHRDVLDKWRNEKHFDEIKRRLGARFVLTTSRFARSLEAGESSEVECQLKNVGFASLYNPRLVEFVLQNDASGQLHRFPMDVDPRHWKPGKSYRLREEIVLSSDLAPGAYSVYLNLPDPHSTLYKDPRYSFRLANQDVWEPQTGFNKLGNISIK